MKCAKERKISEEVSLIIIRQVRYRLGRPERSTMNSGNKPTPRHFPRILKMPFVSGITLLCLLIGGCWMYFSDLPIGLPGKTTGEHWCTLSTSRGLIFIFSTGALLFLALNYSAFKLRPALVMCSKSKDVMKLPPLPATGTGTSTPYCRCRSSLCHYPLRPKTAFENPVRKKQTLC